MGNITNGVNLEVRSIVHYPAPRLKGYRADGAPMAPQTTRIRNSFVTAEHNSGNTCILFYG
jgi:hypothetical protein